MIRLAQFPEEHRGLDLRQCGLLFLSTPHSGSNEASWNKYFRYLGDAFGLRSDSFSNMLKTFNEQSVQSKEYFGTINPAPPFECLYETRITRIGCIPRRLPSKPARLTSWLSARQISHSAGRFLS